MTAVDVVGLGAVGCLLRGVSNPLLPYLSHSPFELLLLLLHLS